MFLKKPYKKGQFLVVKSIAWFPEIDHFKPSLWTTVNAVPGSKNSIKKVACVSVDYFESVIPV